MSESKYLEPKENRISETKVVKSSDGCVEDTDGCVEDTDGCVEDTVDMRINRYESVIEEIKDKIKELKKEKSDTLNEKIKRLLSKRNEFGRQMYTQSEVKKISGASQSIIKKIAKEIKNNL